MNTNISKTSVGSKISYATMFTVSTVWFSTHAGGGFASGNQAIQFFAQYGWYGAFLPIVSMGLLALVVYQVLVMASSRGITSYADFFKTLYHPYEKLHIGFEIFNYIVVLSAVGAAIAGAATLFTGIGVPYAGAVLIVGGILVLLTIFGASIVIKASTVMTLIIIVTAFSIYIVGAGARAGVLTQQIATRQADFGFAQAFGKMMLYTGFQCLALPAMIGCSNALKCKTNAKGAAIIGFIINGLGLSLSLWMIMGWLPEIYAANETTLPTLYVCKQLGSSILTVFYTVSLFICFISTGVTCIYGMVSRLENVKALTKETGFLSNIKTRRIGISIFFIILCMSISMVGLSNIIKYGYSYSGYIGIALIIIPVLTIGRKKNKEWLKEHQDFNV